MEQFNYRKANNADVEDLKNLAITSWNQFEKDLTKDNWNQLLNTISNLKLYKNLINNSQSFICETTELNIVGMIFIVPSGNPTELFQKDWAYIRFLTVSPLHSKKGIGKELSERCITFAKIERRENYSIAHL